MKKISLILAIAMVFAAMFSFTSCFKLPGNGDGDKDEDKGDGKDAHASVNAIDPKDADLHEMVAEIEKVAPYGDYVSEILYKEDDPDEMVKWTYGVVDINAEALLSDYVITMYSDYSNTLAILKFEDGMTDEDFEEVKEVITKEYIKTRASALQMYMPEEYGIMDRALQHPEAIWRQYGDNMLVLAIYGDGEPTEIWDAIDAYLAGETK